MSSPSAITHSGALVKMIGAVGMASAAELALLSKPERVNSLACS